MSKAEALTMLAIGMLVGFWIGMGVGMASANGAIRKKAIAAGSARWEIDPASGERAFVFLPADARKDGSDGRK